MTNFRRKDVRRSGAILWLAVTPLLTLSVGCRGCGPEQPKSALLDLAKDDTQIAFTIADLTQAAQTARAFFDNATKKTGAMATSVQNAAQKQLGFDPFAPEGYASAGIDPSAGLIFFSEGASPDLVLALKVADQKKINEWIAATLKRLDGATELKEEQAEGLKLRTVGRPFGTELIPVSHWTFVDDVVLVSQAAGRASLINAAKRLQAPQPESKTLADDPLYQKLVGKLPADSTFKVFFRGTAARAVTGSEPSELSKGAALGMTFSGKGFGGDFFIDFAVPGLAEALSGAAPADLASLVGEDALAVMLTQSAKVDALEALRKEPALAGLIDTALAAFEREAGMNARTEVLPLLAGPMTGGLYLVDPQRALGTLQRGAADPNAYLDVIHASVTAEVRDREKMLGLLDQAKTKLDTATLKLEKTESERNGKPLVRFEPDRPAPRLGWALYGNTYVYGAGTGRLDAMLDVLDGKKPALKLEGPGKTLGQKEGASVFVFRVGQAGDRVGALASELGAAGPMGQLVTSAVDTAKTIGDLALSLEADPDGLRVTVREVLGE